MVRDAVGVAPRAARRPVPVREDRVPDERRMTVAGSARNVVTPDALVVSETPAWWSSGAVSNTTDTQIWRVWPKLTSRFAQRAQGVSADRPVTAVTMTVQRRYCTIRANSSASRLAPPTRAPSMSGCAMSSLALVGFTDPPYWIRTEAAASLPAARATVARIRLHTDWASSALAVRPVPMAQMGSLASIGAATSPVNAPLSSGWQFWAPSAIGIGCFSLMKYVCTVRRSVKGGWTDTSHAS